MVRLSSGKGLMWWQLDCRTVTGAVSSTPGAALDCCLNIPPNDIFVRSVAKGSFRLQSENLWKGIPPLGCCKITQMHEDHFELDVFFDYLKVCYSFSNPFKIVFPDRQE